MTPTQQAARERAIQAIAHYIRLLNDAQATGSDCATAAQFDEAGRLLDLITAEGFGTGPH